MSAVTPTAITVWAQVNACAAFRVCSGPGNPGVELQLCVRHLRPVTHR